MLRSLKGKRLYSILNSKCPRCHEGDVYAGKNPYAVKDFGKTKDHCPNCGLKYEKEPGFFYGAMYVSYALTVAFSVAIAVALYVLFRPESYIVYMVSIIAGLVVLMPITFRLSRVIWLNFFQSYEGDKALKKSSHS